MCLFTFDRAVMLQLKLINKIHMPEVRLTIWLLYELLKSFVRNTIIAILTNGKVKLIFGYMPDQNT